MKQKILYDKKAEYVLNFNVYTRTFSSLAPPTEPLDSRRYQSPNPAPWVDRPWAVFGRFALLGPAV